jgi:tRNA uridine 5-carboxymethylaminomethyl modification enzyme
MGTHFDIVVVGAGHAGCEAALAAARLGRSVAVVTLSRAHIARLSCNPAIGGMAKGNLVREVDALGGTMARAADFSCIQFRRLNTRKGLAVRSSRAQVDISRYPEAMAQTLLGQQNLSLIEGEVARVLVENSRITGVALSDGVEVRGTSVILTTGTFLAGVMHCGEQQSEGGRVGDASTAQLSHSLRDLGLRLGRLKTGTTPRLDGRTIHWDQLEVQADTDPSGCFSFAPVSRTLPQIDCYVTHTHAGTHEIIRAALDRSPMYTGAISGAGPRYCPSIEDKIIRFAHRQSHLLFLEPEGLDTDRVYVAGLSTSLPAEVQKAVVHSIPGLQDATILQHGYAVEYDYADPRDLDHGLQHKTIPGLYLAGQVNGTSGYEEAAIQGLIAGTSAALGAPLRLGREQAYGGVLVDDLVTRGVGGEPYRMFSSRAEHRLRLREDNADRRLTPLGRETGLVGDAQWARFCTKMEAIEQTRSWCEEQSLRPTPGNQARLEELGLSSIKNKASVAQLLRRPEFGWEYLEALGLQPPEASEEVIEQVVTDTRYAGYLKREEIRAENTRKMEGVRLPADLDFSIPGISHEVAERLRIARPATLGAASRLPGVTPAAIDVLAIHLSRRSA